MTSLQKKFSRDSMFFLKKAKQIWNKSKSKKKIGKRKNVFA